jgi:hypothetical protein
MATRKSSSLRKPTRVSRKPRAVHFRPAREADPMTSSRDNGTMSAEQPESDLTAGSSTRLAGTRSSGRARNGRRGRRRSTTGQFPSASAFVRAQPVDIPAKEVVQAGAKIGIRVTPNLVRIVRYKMRRAGQAPPAPARRGNRLTARRVRGAPSRGYTPAEAQFRKLVVELGTARANALVAAVEQAMQSLVTTR